MILIGARIILSVCPRCGAKVDCASKVWSIMAKNGNRSGEPQVYVGTFRCPVCKTRFGAQIPAEAKNDRAVNVKNKIERIMQIQGELMQTIKTLKDKIAALEAEKSSLMTEIETLRKTAEARVVTLEAEVGQMREEAKSLRELIEKADSAVLISPDSPTVTN